MTTVSALESELLRVSGGGDVLALFEHLHSVERQLKSDATSGQPISSDGVRSVLARHGHEQIATRLARIQVALLDRTEKLSSSSSGGSSRNAAFEFLLASNSLMGTALTPALDGALMFGAHLYEALGRRVQGVRALVPETLTLTLKLLSKSRSSCAPSTRSSLLQLLRGLLLALPLKKLEDAKLKESIVKLLRAELGADESSAFGSPLEKAHALRVLLPYVGAVAKLTVKDLDVLAQQMLLKVALEADKLNRAAANVLGAAVIAYAPGQLEPQLDVLNQLFLKHGVRSKLAAAAGTGKLAAAGARAFLTQAFVACLVMQPRSVLYGQLAVVVRCVFGLLQAPIAAADLAHARRAVGIVLRYGVGARRDEPLQLQLVSVLLDVLRRADSFSPAVTVAALHELSALVEELGPSAAPVSDALFELCRALSPTMLAASLCIASLCRALPEATTSELGRALDAREYGTVAAVCAVIGSAQLGIARALLEKTMRRCAAETGDPYAFAALSHLFRHTSIDELKPLLPTMRASFDRLFSSTATAPTELLRAGVAAFAALACDSAIVAPEVVRMCGGASVVERWLSALHAVSTNSASLKKPGALALRCAVDALLTRAPHLAGAKLLAEASVRVCNQLLLDVALPVAPSVSDGEPTPVFLFGTRVPLHRFVDFGESGVDADLDQQVSLMDRMLGDDGCCYAKTVDGFAVITFNSTLEQRSTAAALQLFATLFAGNSAANQDPMIQKLLKATKGAAQLNAIEALRRAVHAMAQRRLACDARNVAALRKLLLPLVAGPEAAHRAIATEALATLAALDGADSLAQELVGVVRSTMAQATANSALKRGCALLLAQLARSIGGMRGGGFLPTATELLLKLCIDADAEVRLDALRSLVSTIDAAGLSYAPHASRTLELVATAVATGSLAESSDGARQQALGRVVNAVVAALGPELRAGSRAMVLSDAVCVGALQRHEHELVQLEAILYRQSLIMFAPQTIDERDVVPRLRAYFSSPYLSVRATAVACLRQLAQSNAARISEIAQGTLEEQLFDLLDSERDASLRTQISAVLRILLEALAPSSPARWVRLCKRLVQATSRNTVKTPDITVVAGGVDADEEPDDTPEEPTETGDEEPEMVAPRWWTKLQAMQCIEDTVFAVAEQPSCDAAHWDLAAARQRASSGRAEWLVLCLNDLLSVAFGAATAAIAPLRPRGVRLMRTVVERFSVTLDPDYEGHHLLEQYAAQIGSSLRAAFEADAAPELTAAACPVVATYAGAVLQDETTLEARMLPLLLGRIEKLRSLKYAQFGDHATTMVQLALLGAVAKLHTLRDSPNATVIARRLAPLLPQLYGLWRDAMFDVAVIDASDGRPLMGGAFFAAHSAADVRAFFAKERAVILDAATLCAQNDATLIATKDDFSLLLGIAMDQLSRASVDAKDRPGETQPIVDVQLALERVSRLLSKPLLHGGMLARAVATDVLRAVATLMRHAHAPLAGAAFGMLVRVASFLPLDAPDSAELLGAVFELIAAPLVVAGEPWSDAVRTTAARALTLVAAHGAAALRPFFSQAINVASRALSHDTEPATVVAAAASFATLAKAAPDAAADRSLIIECVRAAASSLAGMPSDAPTLLVQARVEALFTHVLPTVDDADCTALVIAAASAMPDAHVLSLLPVLTQLVAQRADFLPLVGQELLPRAVSIGGALLRRDDAAPDAQNDVHLAAIVKLLLVFHALCAADKRTQTTLLERVVLPFGADCLYNASEARQTLWTQVLHRLMSTDRDAFLAGVAALKARDEAGAIRVALAVRTAELAAERERQAEAQRVAEEQARVAQREALKKKQQEELQAAKKKTLNFSMFEDE
jgi:hypothetical protein